MDFFIVVFVIAGIVFVLGVFLIIYSSRYKKVGPNEVLVIRDGGTPSRPHNRRTKNTKLPLRGRRRRAHLACSGTRSDFESRDYDHRCRHTKVYRSRLPITVTVYATSRSEATMCPLSLRLNSSVQV